MERKILKSSIAAGLLSLLFCFAPKGGTLKDIAKPYLGEYECKSARLGDKDFLDELKYLRMELKPNNVCVLRYCPKNGKTREWSGEYDYDRQTQTLRLRGEGQTAFDKRFPLKEGMLTVAFPVGEKTMILTFAQK